MNLPARPDTAVNERQQAVLACTLDDYFAQRPTLQSVAAGLVRDMLAADCPQPPGRLVQAALVEPLPSTGDGPGPGYRSLPLADLLIERFLDKAPRRYAPGSYLTFYPGAEAPQQLPLGIDRLQALLDEWAPLLLEACKQDLVDFWNSPSALAAPPWQLLSEFFAQQLRQASAALAGDELASVQAVLDYPDLHARQAVFGRDCAQAYICIIDTRVSDPEPLHVQALVLSRWVGQRQIVLLYSLSGGIEAFESTDALEASLGLTLSGQDSDFRNYSPDQHVFDALTMTLLKRQLEAIAALEADDCREPASLDQRLHELTGLQALFGAFRSGHEAKLQRLGALLPDWLRTASPTDRGRYGRYVAALSTVHRGHLGKGFLDGIPALGDFAREALQARLEVLHPGAAALSVGDISVTLTPVLGSALAMGDGFRPVGGAGTPVRRDYIAMALQNLAAFPLAGHAQVHLKGQPAPAWMTYEVLRSAVSAADIGAAYPALLKRTLCLDLAERTRQQGLFIDYLAVLLPMLALELRLKGQLSERARLQIEALATQGPGVAEVQGQRIVARPLALRAHPNAHADRVRNMFVLGPQASDQGPQVLYRPACTEAFVEFASLAGVLAAIQVEGPLQQSVLAGLDSARRSTYDHGGFKEPHLARVTSADWSVPDRPGPVTLEPAPLAGAFAVELFAASVEALIARAEAVTVADGEDRWNRFIGLGWALLNVLVPWSAGPLGCFGVLVALIASLERFADPHASEPWLAFADILLNLAVLLVYRRPRVREAAAGAASPRPIVDNAVAKRPAVRVENARVFAWTRPGRAFTASERARLETFKLALAKPPGRLLGVGEWQGLYQAGEQFYARVDDAWFRVSRSLEGVVIIDDRHPARHGPWLKPDGAGAWQLDRGPRLLGGVGTLSVRASKKLKSLEKSARDLLASVPALLRDAERDARWVQAPRDIQDRLKLQAQPFEDKLKELQAMTQGLAQSSRVLLDELRQASDSLAEKGLELRIGLTRSSLPTVAGVEFLHEQEQISIRRVGPRRDISAGKGNDFLEEYEIRDSQGTPLWYAHFHYPAASTPAANFAKAHLKTLAQRRHGIQFQMAQQAAGKKVEAILRQAISPGGGATRFLPVRG